MRFAIVGSGMIARFHAEAINKIEKASLVAIISQNADTAWQLANEFGARVYRNIDEAIKEETIDIVTIATPSGAHLEPCIAAAKNGIHVICEKPLEVTASRIRKMIKVCDDHSVKLSGILNRRFNPSVEKLKQTVSEGRFGQMTLCSAFIKWYRTPEYYQSAAWRGTKKLDGGGALMNQGIHTVDLLLYVAGDVKRVSASMTNVLHHEIEVEDTIVALLEFETGALGVIEATTAAWSENGHPAEIQLVGTTGSVYLADESFKVWEFKNSKIDDELVKNNLMVSQRHGLGAIDPKAINTTGHERNFLDFMTAIEENRKPSVDGYEALKSVALINAIYNSAQNKGRWVNLSKS